MPTLTATKNLYAYVNGNYVDKDEASISIYDHGFLYGDGVYEAIRAYDGLIFKLREHIDRLYESAKSIKIDIPFSREELGRLVVAVLKKNGLRNSYIRIVISRPRQDGRRSPQLLHTDRSNYDRTP